MTKTVTPVWEQTGYRYRNDDGSETAATWIAAVDTAPGAIDTDIIFRLRIECAETATQTEAETFQGKLQYNLASGGWNDVTTTSPVQYAASADTSWTITDGDATTEQLAGAQAFQAGSMEENAAWAAISTLIAEDTEYEAVLTIDSAQVADNDTLDFRVVHGASSGQAEGTLLTYTQAVGQATVNDTGATVVTPGAIAAVAALPGPSPLAASTVLPGAVAAVSTVPDPTATAPATVNPETIGGAGGGGGGISIVGTVQVGNASNGGDVTLTFDGTPAEGDVVVVVGGHSSNSAAVGPSTAGYTQQKLESTNYRHGVWTKVLGASPDATVVCQGSTSGTDSAAYAAIVLRGVDTTTPMDAAVVQAGPTTSADPDPGSITTVTDGAWVIITAGGPSADGGITHPAGYSNTGYTLGVDTNRHVCSIGSKEVATAGAENPAAYSGWVSFDWTAFTVAVRPATASAMPVTVPTPTIDVATDTTVNPAAIAAITALDTPTLLAASTVTPDVITAIAAVDGPTPLAAALVAPDTIGLLAALDNPSVLAAALVTPTTIATLVGVDAPTLLAAALVTPGLIPAVVGVDQPAIVIDAGAFPDVIAAIAALDTPTILAGTTSTPDVIAALTTLPTPDAGSDTIINADPLQMSVIMDPVTVAGEGVVSPDGIPLTATVDQPTAQGEVAASPDPITAVTAADTPTIVAAADVVPATVTLVTNLDAPTVASAQDVNPNTVTVVVLLDAPTITGLAVVSPDLIRLVTQMPRPDLLGVAHEIVARALYRFYRIDGRLVMAPVPRAVAKSFGSGEGFEVVSDVIRVDQHETQGGHSDRAMIAVAAAWAANSGAPAATLKTALHTALQSAGWRGRGGVDLI